MRDDASLPPGMGILWRRDEERRRPGRRPGLSLDGIADAAIGLADAEGLGGVSMARVAGSLGVTTMALYRYVDGKDELLALVYDRVMAVPPLPDDGPWRTRLEAWCRAQVDVLRQHPWIVDLTGLPPIGPNRVRWVEAGLAALSGTPLTVGVQVALTGMLSLHMLTQGQLIAAFAAQAAGRETDHPALVDYGTLLRAVVDPAEHPRVAAAVSAGAFDDDGAEPGFETELALGLLLDGVAALVERAR